MKKFASALAVAAALGVPAVASAEITPYITIDASIGFADKKYTGNQNDFDYYHGNIATSVIGVKASQDIGNGLKVVGHFEGEVLESGDWNDFSRYAYVGVQGGFGQVTVGSHLNPMLAFWGGSTWAMGGNTASSNTAVFGGFGQFWVDRGIAYSVKTGGLTAQVMYSFEDRAGESRTPVDFVDLTDPANPDTVPGIIVSPVAPTSSGTAGYESLISGFAKYDFGMFNLGVAGQQINGEDVGGWDQTTWMIGGGVDIAGIKLRAGYVDNERERGSATLLDLDAWHVGVAYGFTPQITAGVDYFQDSEDRKLVNAQVRYAMAKNLMLYGMVNYVDNDGDSDGNYRVLYGETGAPVGNDDTGVALGMIVSF